MSKRTHRPGLRRRLAVVVGVPVGMLAVALVLGDVLVAYGSIPMPIPAGWLAVAVAALAAAILTLGGLLLAWLDQPRSNRPTSPAATSAVPPDPGVVGPAAALAVIAPHGRRRGFCPACRRAYELPRTETGRIDRDLVYAAVLDHAMGDLDTHALLLRSYRQVGGDRS